MKAQGTSSGKHWVARALRGPIGALVALAVLALFAMPATGAAASEPGCSSPAMHIVAHQDDDLLFQSPALLQDIQSGRCVQTVFMTAGDDGQDQPYWSGREKGVEAAYAQMAGADDEWTLSEVTANGHPIHMASLDGAPEISLAFMRLPDGDVSGEGTPLYGFESLLKLWDGSHPGSGRPEISSITAVDDSTSYGYADLIETLTVLIDSYQPQQIATQNFAEGIFEGDHPDHIMTAYFVREAEKLYAPEHQFLAYQGYDVAGQPETVSGSLLAAKSSAFYKYGTFDSGACESEVTCASTPYAGWLKRQHVTATKSTPGAAAGPAQTVLTGATVTLDGSGSSDPSSLPLTYKWTQTAGPTVKLTGPTTAKPSFLAPATPASLTFSLVVTNKSMTTESRSSLPSAVSVEVKAPPAPEEEEKGGGGGNGGGGGGGGGAAPGAPPAIVSASSFHAAVGKQFQLRFEATGTPAPALSISGPIPSGWRFDAAPGSATLSGKPTAAHTFRLTLTAQSNAGTVRQAVTVVVDRRPSLGRRSVDIVPGKASRQVIPVSGSPRPAIRCKGRLPHGVSCRATKGGNVVVKSTGAATARGTYHPTVVARNRAGTARHPLTVRVLPQSR